ncbi:MAG: hypothetical protein E7461_03875 [Ruminococcaceae bacterium]|nr:hypothetical protein [Oscillospiraceae bacterium]
MKLTRKMVLAGIMAVLTCVTLLLGCTTGDNIAPAEKWYSKDFGGFSTRPQDPRMTIDGVLDEELWEGKDWFQNAFLHDVNGVYPKFRVTGFPTEYGIYVAAVTDDTNIICNGQRATSVQSVFQFEITADPVGEYRVDDGLYKTKYNFDMRGDVYTRNPNVDREVVVNGEVNSGNTQGATLEFFIAWEDMNVDISKGIPEEFRMQCTYLACLPGKDGLNFDMVSTSYTSILTRDFFRFGENGYVTADREGATVGDSYLGNNKTANWDISKEAEGIVQSSGGTDKHIIFFKEHLGSDFIVETTVIPVKSLGEPYPKAGIWFQGTDSYNSNKANHYGVLLNCADNNLVEGPNGTKNFKTYWLASLHSNGGWTMTTIPGTNAITNTNAATQEGVKLTAVKYGGMLLYFCDGKFMGMEEVDFMDQDVLPGFYTLGMDAIFKDYSCKPITEKDLKDYLGSREIYLIDAMAKGVQGTVTASASTVNKGESVDITITTKPGWRVSTVMINDEEKLADVQKNAKHGVYTISNVVSHLKIRVGYEKVEGFKLTGTVTDGTNTLTADVKLNSTTDQSLSYTFIANGAKGFDVNVPAGTYQLVITSLGYKPLVKTITVDKNIDGTYALEESEFLPKVEINGSVITSNVDKWDMTNLADGKISTSYGGGGKDKPLYFKQTAADFAVEISAKYTTKFIAGGDYQRNLMAGFRFNDGRRSSLFCVVDRGTVYTDLRNNSNYVYKQDVLPDTERVLYYWPDWGYSKANDVTFGIAKVGDDVSVYINGQFAYAIKWSTICAGMDPSKDVAIGMVMIADKTADLEISNYSLKTGTAAAQAYISAHSGAGNVPKNETLAANPMFSVSQVVNGKQVDSKVSNWDLSNVASGVVNGSYAMGSKQRNLYFTGVGKTALAKATFDYTTTFEAGKTYQRNLMGGFAITDGTNTGYVLAVDKGVVVITDKGAWNFVQTLLEYRVLYYYPDWGFTDPAAVQLSVALKDGELYVYIDGKYVYKTPLTTVLTGYTSGDVSFGLAMAADATADIRCNSISYTTNATTVSTFIKDNDAVIYDPLIAQYANYANMLGQGKKIGKLSTDLGTAALTSNTTMFIGDSFFDSREAWWSDFYTTDYAGKDVFLAGIGGSRADQWNLMVDMVFASFKDKAPKNIVINLGTNDLASGKTVAEASANLQKLITTLKQKYPQTNIYYCGVIYRQATVTNATVDSFNNAMSQWCGQQSNVTYLGMSTKVTVDMLQDGLHPKEATYDLYVKALQDAGCVIASK